MWFIVYESMTQQTLYHHSQCDQKYQANKIMINN